MCAEIAPTGAGVRLERMSQARFDAWSTRSMSGFASQQVASGLQPAVEARAYAAAALAAELPQGPDTPGHHLWTVHSGDSEIGRLWMRVRRLSTEVEAYLLDVEVEPAVRGLGLGRLALAAAQDAARGLGADVLRLNVFGHNTVAIRLYEGAGLRVARALLTRRWSDLDTDRQAGTVDDVPVELVAMTGRDYAAFRSRIETELPAEMVRAGLLPLQEARRQVGDDARARLPRGMSSPNQLLRTAYLGGVPVSDLWLQLRTRSDGRHVALRRLTPRQGCERHEAGVVAALERWSRQNAVASVEATAFGFEVRRCSLYARAGFRLTAQTMVRRLVMPR